MWSKNNNKKGFSMIELLAAIVILGIISTAAIVSIRYLINRSKVNHYKTLVSNISVAANLYANSSTTNVPRNIGQKSTIKLKELVDNNYIKDVKDYNKETCSEEETYIDIFKYAKNKYSYYVHLSCPNYETDVDSEYNLGPKIEIAANNNNEKATITIKTNVVEYGSVENKILSYKYILYIKDETTNQYIETTNSGDIEAGIVKSITKEVPLSGPIPSEYKLSVTAVDIYGNASTKSKKIQTEDNSVPGCEIIEQAEDDDDWTNSERLVTVKCIDSESGCEQETYTKLFTEEAKNETIVIKDNSGNTKNCIVRVNIDKTAPTVPNVTLKQWADNSTAPTSSNYTTLTNYTAGNWSAKKVYTKASGSTDSGSGNIKYYYTTTGKTTNATDTQSSSRNIEANGTSYIKYKACDAAGNCSDYTPIYTIKIDSKAPSVPSIVLKQWANNSTTPTTSNYTTLTNYTAGNWSNLNVFTTATGSIDVDTLGGSDCSGGVKYYYTTTGATTNNTDKNASTRSVEANGTSQIKYKACDAVGNCSSYVTNTIKIDKTPPTCNISKSGTLGNNNWYTSNVTVKLTQSDALSGVNSYGLATTANTYNSKTSATQADTNGVTYYGVVKDKAGNVTTCSETFKVDTTSPSLPTVTLKQWADNDTRPTTSNYTTLTNYTAGNWSPLKIYTIASSSDNGGSGNLTYYYTTTGTTTNETDKTGRARSVEANGTSYIKYKACDAAGNCSSYTSNYTMKVDKTAPTCTITLSGTEGNNNWYTSNVTVKLTQSDALSGVNSYGLATTAKTYNSKISTTQSDTNGVTYYGVVKDKAGNVTTCSKTFKVDTTSPSLPTVTLKQWADNSTAPTSSNYTSLTKYTAGNWSTLNIYTKASGSTDSGSGSIKYYYTTTGTTTNETATQDSDRNIKTEGTSKIKYKACDAAGNCSAYTSNYTIKIDKSKPSAPTIKLSSTSETSSNVTFTLSGGSDDYSGVQKLQYKIGSGSWTNYSSRVTLLTTTGTKTVYARTVDNVGYISSSVSAIGKCDKDAVTVDRISNRKDTSTGYCYFTLSFSTANSLTGVSGYDYVYWNPKKTSDTSNEGNGYTCTTDNSDLNNPTSLTRYKTSGTISGNTIEIRQYYSTQYYCLAIRPHRATEFSALNRWTVQMKHATTTNSCS